MSAMTDLSSRSLLGRGLFYGTPVFAAAITLAFAFLDQARVLPLGDYDVAVMCGNVAVACIGAAAGGALGRGRTGIRVATALVSAVVGFFAYAMLFIAGMIAMGR